MKGLMSFEKAEQRAIDSGLLSDKEIYKLKNARVEMFKLLEKESLSFEDKRKIERFRYIFDDLAVKGMPEYEHLRPKSRGVKKTIITCLVFSIIFISCSYFLSLNA